MSLEGKERVCKRWCVLGHLRFLKESGKRFTQMSTMFISGEWDLLDSRWEGVEDKFFTFYFWHCLNRVCMY